MLLRKTLLLLVFRLGNDSTFDNYWEHIFNIFQINLSLPNSTIQFMIEIFCIILINSFGYSCIKIDQKGFFVQLWLSFVCTSIWWYLDFKLILEKLLFHATHPRSLPRWVLDIYQQLIHSTMFNDPQKCQGSLLFVASNTGLEKILLLGWTTSASNISLINIRSHFLWKLLIANVA